MGIKALIQKSQVSSSVKQVAVLGEDIYIRLYSVSEGEHINALPESERPVYILKTCVVNKDGTPAMTEEDVESLKNSADKAMEKVLREIFKYNNEAFQDPKH